MKIILANPRGFCAGVRRAIEIVNRAIAKFGTPLYVKHEIVHNDFVVNDFKSRGVIFTDDLSQIPHGSTIVFSAHGVSDIVEEQSANRSLNVIDATCPLVTKVHKEVQKYDENGVEILLIGHKGHPEMEGTAGKIKGKYTILETIEDVESFTPQSPENLASPNLALATQTTLSLDDTKQMVDRLLERFPNISKHYKSDICYATQNRQNIVKSMIGEITKLVVIGSEKSSNSNRLKDIGTQNNIPAFLINSVKDLDFSLFSSDDVIGLTAGASAPDHLVHEVIAALKQQFNASLEFAAANFEEDVIFHLPRQVR